MRSVLLGLAGLALAACGDAGGSTGESNSYGAKPSGRETVELAGDEGDLPDNQEITGTPTGMTQGGGGEASSTPGQMSQNQSRPMQAAQ